MSNVELITLEYKYRGAAQIYDNLDDLQKVIDMLPVGHAFVLDILEQVKDTLESLDD